MAADMVEGWHFLTADRRLGYDDGREVVAGETLTVDGMPVLCRRGLHASQRAIDALRYAQGFLVSRVRLTGVIVHGDDKACATERTTVWLADARTVVLGWACWCAWGALLGQAWRGRHVDPRSVRVLEVTEAWIAGEAIMGCSARAGCAAGHVTEAWIAGEAIMEEVGDARAAYAAAAAPAYAAYAAYAAAYAAYADAADAAAVAADYADYAADAAAADAASMRAMANAELERRLWMLASAREMPDGGA